MASDNIQGLETLEAWKEKRKWNMVNRPWRAK